MANHSAHVPLVYVSVNINLCIFMNISSTVRLVTIDSFAKGSCIISVIDEFVISAKIQ